MIKEHRPLRYSIGHSALLGLSCLGVSIMCVSTLSAAEDLKVVQLEQDVRDLQRELRQQAQRIESLEHQLPQSRPYISSPLFARPKAKSDVSSAWLNIANWDKVRSGMSELEVIGVLGPPTTLRKSPEGEVQTLLYAMELGSGSFLAGSVRVTDHRVVEVLKPTLK